MEQIVWAVIFIIFIILTALRNRARKRPEHVVKRERHTEEDSKEDSDRLGRYLEEILGVEITEKRPQPRVKKERPGHEKTRVTPAPEQGKVRKIGESESLLTGKHEKEWKSPIPEKKAVCRAKFSWGTLSKKNLPNAIILAEIIGPPIAKRKGHRLF